MGSDQWRIEHLAPDGHSSRMKSLHWSQCSKGLALNEALFQLGKSFSEASLKYLSARLSRTPPKHQHLHRRHLPRIRPPNIEIIYLPPRSHELNPVERLWRWLKMHTIRNRLYPALGEVMDSVQECLNSATPDFLRGLCRCSYLLH